MREINVAGARLAREVADRFTAADPARPRWVAGSIGPTNRTLSLSPDVEDPGARAVDFDEVYDAYREQALALHDGGVDLFLVETMFDTLNAKAALKAILDLRDEGLAALPIWISGTITDRSGRTLSGQTVDAFWTSVRHAEPFAVGLNCALGARADASATSRSWRRRPTRWCRPIPTPVCRTSSASTRRAPRRSAAQLREWAQRGLVNVVGGCCGTTPEHIRAIADAVSDIAPRAGARDRADAAPVRPRTVRRQLSREPSRAPRSHASSTSASARTSPGRRTSSAWCVAGDYDGGADGRALADRAAGPRSSTSTWTTGCSTASRR